MFFGVKRAYWGCIKKSRKLLRLHWPHLTAARFDLMHALSRRREAAILQSALRRVLGVCRPVLTRMLKALVELGWVTRTRSLTDRRTYEIRITEEGEKVKCAAYHRLVRSMRAARWVHQALVGMPDWPDKGLAIERMELLEWLLRCLRQAFEAGGTLHYRWHPDD